jgi:hypothetical protein
MDCARCCAVVVVLLLRALCCRGCMLSADVGLRGRRAALRSAAGSSSSRAVARRVQLSARGAVCRRPLQRPCCPCFKPACKVFIRPQILKKHFKRTGRRVQSAMLGDLLGQPFCSLEVGKRHALASFSDCCVLCSYGFPCNHFFSAGTPVGVPVLRWHA